MKVEKLQWKVASTKKSLTIELSITFQTKLCDFFVFSLTCSILLLFFIPLWISNWPCDWDGDWSEVVCESGKKVTRWVQVSYDDTLIRWIHISQLYSVFPLSLSLLFSVLFFSLPKWHGFVQKVSFPKTCSLFHYVHHTQYSNAYCTLVVFPLCEKGQRDESKSESES